MTDGIGEASDLAERSRAGVEAVVATFLEIPDPFIRRAPESWSAGEHFEHLRLSVRPLNLALMIPRFALRVFGKPRAQRTYEQVVEQYRENLAKGARATAPFIPSPLVKSTDRDRLVREFRNAHATYAERLALVDDALLDSIRLPHPILRRLSLREMAYFTIYHLAHHHEAIRRSGRSS